MKAISLHQPYASWIQIGKKTIETRKWPTKFRGDLLICATKKPVVDPYPNGVALCVIEVYHCEIMLEDHEDGGCIEVYPNAHSWFFRNLRRLSREFPVKGSQGFFSVDIPADVTLIPVDVEFPEPSNFRKQQDLFGKPI